MPTSNLPAFFDRPDLAGAPGILLLPTTRRKTYKGRFYPDHQCAAAVPAMLERFANHGPIEHRPIAKDKKEVASGLVVVANVWFNHTAWQHATKKATTWAPDVSRPHDRAALFFDKKGALVAVLMPIIPGKEVPGVVKDEEYAKAGLHGPKAAIANTFASEMLRLTPTDRWQHLDNPYHVVCVPQGHDRKEAIAQTTYKHLDPSGWHKVAPPEHTCDRAIGHTPPPPGVVKPLPRLMHRLTLWYNRNSKKRAVRRANLMPIATLKGILGDPDAMDAFGPIFTTEAEQCVRKAEQCAAF